MSLKIGICDDEELIAKQLKRMMDTCLNELNQEAETQVFLSGMQLLEKVKELDAVFLDVRMEGMDGYETGRRIRTLNPDCLIIMATCENAFFEKLLRSKRSAIYENRLTQRK